MSPTPNRSPFAASCIKCSHRWTLAVVLVLGAIACAHAAVPECLPPPDQRLPNEIPGIEVSNEQILKAINQVDSLAHQAMVSSKIPGMAIAIVHGGQTVFAKGYGVRSLDTGASVDADTVFQLASISKPLGATVVAQQVGKGIVDWNAPIQKWMHDFQLSDPYVSEHVTLADLYSHRSGLPEHAGDLLEDIGYTRAQILKRIRLLPLAPFRNTYAYTNFGLTAAAEATAMASGVDWATLSEQAIYAPLGMHSTSSRYSDFIARTNHAVGHVKRQGRFVVSKPGRQPDAQSPAGGASSSVNDMAHWMNMVLRDGSVSGHSIVQRCALLQAVSPQIVSGSPARAYGRASFYGLGFNVSDSAAGRVILSHSGAFSLGAGTAFTLIPSLDVGIITLTNAQPYGVPETINAEFSDLVQFGRITQDWATLYPSRIAPLNNPVGNLIGKTPPLHPKSSRVLARYQGVYQNAYYGDVTVKVVGKSLILALGPTQRPLPLRHWDGDVFVFSPPGESEPEGSISTATFNDDDLSIEYLGGEHPATFSKSACGKNSPNSSKNCPL